ncbi:hypothetical protein J9317_10350 [Metabacillus sp. KIGAM252]|uniref:Uncharacterized protein n=1 Tax=Metabacillus flavus TaxID=2823519 RepID=A0ABS5LEJ2_9BACI|nr:hypothetical protein [Metabacillus flavus]MBS2969162.1 hypothetical protein [Metabacillus flavus]
MSLFAFSILLQILLFFYFEATTLLNLYPWNDLAKYTNREKTLEAASNGLVILISMGLFISHIKWLMTISVIFWFIFLIMQLLTWWMPYLTGRHLKQFPKSLYETHFIRTIKILPRVKDHIVPDAQHNVLQFISLITVIVSALSIFYA